MKKVFCLILALALVFSAALAETDASQAPLATVDGVDVPVGSAQFDLDYYGQQYEQYAQMYGLTDWLEPLKADIAQYYVRLYLMRREADRLQLSSFDEEEMEALTDEATALYEETVTEYMNYFRDDSMTDEEARAAVVEWLEGQNFTLDWLIESKKSDEILRRYEDSITEGVEASEDEVRALYDERVAAQQAQYDASADAFNSAALNGEVIYYVPEGYRAVYHILLLLSDEDQQTLSALNADLDAAKAALEEGEGDLEALQARIDEIQAEIDALTAPLYERMSEVQARVDAGEDFKSLIPEYNEDPGMVNEPTASNGYYVWSGSQSWVEPFRDAAMAIEEIGGVSDPVLTNYGLHLIYYDRDLTSGPVDYDAIRDDLKAEADEAKRAAVVEATVDGYMENAEIEYHLENLIYELAEDETSAEGETAAEDETSAEGETAAEDETAAQGETAAQDETAQSDVAVEEDAAQDETAAGDEEATGSESAGESGNAEAVEAEN